MEIKRHFGYKGNRSSSRYDTEITIKKIIKVVDSCQTPEQLLQCYDWVKWVIAGSNINEQGDIRKGIYYILGILLNNKKNELIKNI